jgi:hypothetical protein
MILSVSSIAYSILRTRSPMSRSAASAWVATPIQEFPSDVVGLFRAVLKDLGNLRQSDIQLFGSAPHDSSNFTRVSK